MNPHENRNAIIVWSGGLDSTLMLYQIATQEYKYQQIRVVSFQAEFLAEEKINKEAQAREEFRKAFPDLNVASYHTVKLVQDNFWGSTKGSGQAAAWLGMISPFIGDDTDVMMGYIAEDTVWFHHTYLQEIFRLYCELNGFTNTKLIYPLQDHKKIEVIKTAKKRGIYKYTWWCEDPKITLDNSFHAKYFDEDDKRKYYMCGECLPCQTHLRALIFDKAKEEYNNKEWDTFVKDKQSKEVELSHPVQVSVEQQFVGRADRGESKAVITGVELKESQEFLENQKVIWTPKRIDTREPSEPFEIKTLLHGRFPTEAELCNCFDPKSKINTCMVHELLDVGEANCVAVMVEKEGMFQKQMWQRKREDHPPLVKKVAEIHDGVIFDAELSKRDAAKLKKGGTFKPALMHNVKEDPKQKWDFEFSFTADKKEEVTDEKP